MACLFDLGRSDLKKSFTFLSPLERDRERERGFDRVAPTPEVWLSCCVMLPLPLLFFLASMACLKMCQDVAPNRSLVCRGCWLFVSVCLSVCRCGRRRLCLRRRPSRQRQLCSGCLLMTVLVLSRGRRQDPTTDPFAQPCGSGSTLQCKSRAVLQIGASNCTDRR